MPRPKKYKTEIQRLTARKAQIKRSNKKRIIGRYWRLVIPALDKYGSDWTYQTPSIKLLRAATVDLLVAREKSRGLDSYLVAVERHPGSGCPHLDIVLTYSKKIFNTPGRYDYLIKHGDLTKYRTLNSAILEYGQKQDPEPLGPLSTDSAVWTAVMKSRVKSDLYEMMKQAMLSLPDPGRFNPHQWLHNKNLDIVAVKTNVYKVIRMVRDQQIRACNSILASKPGIRMITDQMIKSHLTPAEVAKYHSWAGYSTIITYLNQIPTFGYNRPHKTRNLLIVGRPNTGKTALALQIQKHTAVYYKDVSNWFPSYRPEVYKMVLWNEFSIKGLAYPKLLNYLEGTKMDLEYKGGSVLKTDNQLVYMTSNLTLWRHVSSRFRDPEDRQTAMSNLRARICEVIIPDNLDLFLLLKLIKPF